MYYCIVHEWMVCVNDWSVRNYVVLHVTQTLNRVVVHVDDQMYGHPAPNCKTNEDAIAHTDEDPKCRANSATNT